MFPSLLPRVFPSLLPRVFPSLLPRVFPSLPQIFQSYQTSRNQNHKFMGRKPISMPPSEDINSIKTDIIAISLVTKKDGAITVV